MTLRTILLAMSQRKQSFLVRFSTEIVSRMVLSGSTGYMVWVMVVNLPQRIRARNAVTVRARNRVAIGRFFQ